MYTTYFIFLKDGRNYNGSREGSAIFKIVTVVMVFITTNFDTGYYEARSTKLTIFKRSWQEVGNLLPIINRKKKRILSHYLLTELLQDC